MKLILTTCRGVALGSLACACQAGAQTLLADDAMADYATDANAALTGAAIPAGPELFVGRRAYYSGPNSNHLLHMVVPFQLPDLGQGTFTEVGVAFRAQGDSTWNIPINLWAIPGVRTTSATLGGDVRSATEDHTRFGQLVMAGFFGRDTIRDAYNQTPWWGAESSRLASWLNAGYQDGANHGKFVFLRLSPQALTPAEAGPDEEDSGFAVGAKGFVNAQWRPTLTYTFVEAPAGAPVIGGFSASADEIGETDSATLSWSVTGATSVEIWPEVGMVPATGSAVVMPGDTTTYTLYANNASGERVATTGITVKSSGPAEIPGEFYDGGLHTAPATGAVVGGVDSLSDGRISVGRRAGGVNVDHLVLPFRLPALGQGIFRNVNLSVNVAAGDGPTPGIHINLFGLPTPRALPVPLAADVNQGGQDHRSRGTLIEEAWIHDATPMGELETEENSAASAGLSAWLTDTYANGANAGKYVFLRLSPAALAPVQGTGVRIGAANGPAGARPLLSYEFEAGGMLPPDIASFTATPASISTGWSTTLAWSVGGGETTVRIDPDIGPVPAAGSVTVSPAASTTYTLTAVNPSGTRTATVTVGVGPFRYFRFVPVAVRAGSTVQIAEFQIMHDGARLPGATATNPGGNNPGTEGPEKANDNLTNTKWLDSNRQPLVLDFGTPVVADGYRFATANDADSRDPVSWRVEGSHDGTFWRVLDERSNYATPTQRYTYIATLALPFVGDLSGTLAPPGIEYFTASPASIETGGAATLSWSVNGATAVNISPGIGGVAASGTLVVTPSRSVTYTLSATNAGGGTQRNAQVIVSDRYRWFRFVPVKTRVPAADAVALAEFEIRNQGAKLGGATAGNPGGNVPIDGPPADALDGNVFTKWLDFNKQPLVLDFGAPVAADGYRFAIADYNPRDPVSWRVEGSKDGASWVVLDAKTDFATPSAIESYVSAFAFAPPMEAVPPRVLSFTVHPDQSTCTLVWSSRAGASYTVETSAALGGGLWTVLHAAVPSGGAQTSHTFPRGADPRRFYRVRENP